MHCLIVDDSDVVRKVAASLLTKLQFTVAEAVNSETAVVSFGERLPDLVLVDWQMPGRSGIETISSLRALPGGEGSSIVYLTTEFDPPLITRAIDAGADAYLLKPFTRQSLVERLVEVGMLPVGSASPPEFSHQALLRS